MRETLDRELRIRSVQLPERRKQMYFRSIYSGQVYKLDFIPKGEGWELATEQEYIEYFEALEKAMHIRPEK